MSPAIAMLTVDDVLAIHACLVEDFAAANDPMGPGGVRSLDLLHSAVSRQTTGYQDRLKYDSPVSNAATLAYGLSLNHPFLNGNKRTALVSLLCHFDRNELMFDDSMSQDALYDFMLNVTKHVYSKRGESLADPDVEVNAMTAWLKGRLHRIEKRERVITFRQVKGILGTFGFAFEEPKGNSIEIVKYEKGFFGKKRRRIHRMGNPGDGRTVGKAEVKEIRKACGLTEADGVDSRAFYGKARPIDYFINRYRTTLRRLAKT